MRPADAVKATPAVNRRSPQRSSLLGGRDRRNNTSHKAAASGHRPRTSYRIELRPEPTCTDPIRSLRKALKLLLRTFRLRCTSIEEVRP